jgi:hypothetical protein
VQCWGYNNSLQLGVDEPELTVIPITVPGVRGAIRVTALVFGACALLSSGEVMCWGSYLVSPTSYTPRKIRGLGRAVELASNTDISCAIVGSKR